MIFVDTNYFLRFLVDNGTEQYQNSSDLISQATKGNINLATDIVVIFEIYWVLGNVYKYDVLQIKSALLQICNFDFLIIDEKQTLLKAISTIENFNGDLEDAYHYFYCQSKKITQIATFDKKLNSKFKLLNKCQTN